MRNDVAIITVLLILIFGLYLAFSSVKGLRETAYS
jgi:hypothetical protein